VTSNDRASSEPGNLFAARLTLGRHDLDEGIVAPKESWLPGRVEPGVVDLADRIETGCQMPV